MRGEAVGQVMWPRRFACGAVRSSFETGRTHLLLPVIPAKAGCALLRRSRTSRDFSVVWR
ncbi:hypothetical protein [Lysobacter gummosus]|uniref:hypothetical protein n=1 Tax=Lysobacter gummosus TaxID=262324 RepID=UPI00362C5B88